MELALALGHIDYEAMLDEITPRQWAMWKVFGLRWPIGDRRADVRNSLLISAIDVIVRSLIGEGPCIDPEDLLPFYPDPDPKAKEKAAMRAAEAGWQDPAVTFAILESMAARKSG